MKNLVIVSTFLIGLSILSLNLTAKVIVKETESFTISANSSSAIDLNTTQSWTIKYGEESKLIKIEKSITKTGENYLVRNDFFEVCYSNSNKGFGVKKIKKSQSLVNPIINNAVLNNVEMQKQSLLNATKLSEEKVLNYIASFVPYLLNDNYRHILN